MKMATFRVMTISLFALLFFLNCTLPNAGHTVTFDSQGATVAASPASEQVVSPATTIAALPTPPTKTGYAFSGWDTATNGGGTAFTTSTTVAADITVYANWIAAGSTWTGRALPSSASWDSVAYGNGVFVAVASGGTTAATSPDGITWTPRALPSSASWDSVAYGNGVFVAVAGGIAAATSPDGISWTGRTLPVSANWDSVIFGNGVFVAISNTASTTAATSP